MPKNIDDVKIILYNKKYKIGIKWECVNTNYELIDTNYELGIDFCWNLIINVIRIWLIDISQKWGLYGTE